MRRNFTGMAAATVVGAFALLVILFFGSRHWDTVLASNEKQGERMAEKVDQSEAQRVEAKVARYSPVHQPRSILDDLHYMAALKEKNHDETPIRISTLGSSVSAGAGASSFAASWVGQLLNYLRVDQGLFNTEIYSSGYAGYSTSSLLEEKKYEAVISQQPQVVLLETSLQNDHSQAVPVETSMSNIKALVQILHSKLPEAEIVLLSANPKGVEKDIRNNIGLTMDDYAAAAKKLAEAKKWNYMDVYAYYRSQYKDNLDTILVDGVKPNDKGHVVWFEAVRLGFEKKRDAH
ncbi:SGNH/GDSL hydrolase family protein [Paenibacillus sp. JX-17]|uniref:SGNH/GDSL hydrolase family protein n=1 Tax=Paenibacillus lacisoli TaxID=3064525 RepID=A0ABT9CH74_9BACL|nr:SGNH/GDSL hydrolase family protein [Paenibacillus sp. JX-17]MDO7906943.1 SGNH/GDSL hydrolase family protein [Paenibacillus sp. JX-17]